MATEFKNKGNEALQKKDFKAACDHYTMGLAIEPNNEVLLSNRAAAYLALQKYTEALNDAEKAVQVKPDWSKGYLRKGQALHALQQLDKANEALEKALQLEPDNAQIKKAHSDVRQAMSEQGMQALAGFAKVFADPNIWGKIAANPQLAPFLADQDYVSKVKLLAQNPALIQGLMNDQKILQTVLQLALGSNNPFQSTSEQAQPEAQQPASEQPKKQEAPKPAPQPEPVKEEPKEDAATVEKNLGNAAYTKKKFDEALVHYTKAIELDEQNPVYRLNRAAVYVETGKYDECIAECEKSIELAKAIHDYKSVAKALARIASAYTKQEKLDLAIKYYNDSLTEFRQDDVVKKLHQVEKLKKQKEEQAYINPEIAEQEKNTGNDYFKKNDFPNAVKHYREAIKRNPKNAVYYSNLGSAYIKLGELMYALKNFEQALELDDKFVKAWARKGQCHYFMKEYHKALDAYNKGLAIDPSNAELLDGRQKTYIAIQSAPDEERIRRAGQDPEIQAILQDPMMINVLNDMKNDPKSASKC